MDNESASDTLACRVTDFNVLPLGALIFLAAINPCHNAEFSTEDLHRPNRHPSPLAGHRRILAMRIHSHLLTSVCLLSAIRARFALHARRNSRSRRASSFAALL
jgi:hypothetical protein